MTAEKAIILDDIKRQLGLTDVSEFDEELVMHINSSILTLTQLGVGPDNGFAISKESTWDDFIKDPVASDMVKTFIYMKVRLTFDPPGNSFLIESLQNQLREMEWRFEVQFNNKEVQS